MDGAGAASADPAAELCASQADNISNGPQQGHLRIGVDGVLDAVDLNLWHGSPSSAAVGSGSFLQRIEISNNILPIGLTGEIDEHLGAVNEADRIYEKFVEIGVVAVHIRILHRGGEVELRNRAALAPNDAGKGWP